MQLKTRLALYLFVLLVFSTRPAFPLDDWPSVSPDELKMTSEPLAPLAQAIYLYRQVDRDDPNSREDFYARIKVLTEEGRKRADIEIPFLKGVITIKNLQARVIHPDGRIVDFNGKVFEKTIIKARGVKYLAKAFTLPDVDVGSIIEYRYFCHFENGLIYDSRWLLSGDLFTKHAKFSLKKSSGFALTWMLAARGLPPGTDIPKEIDHAIRLEAFNVPAFESEEYMPPEDEVKFRVDFVYSRNSEKDPVKFWREEGKAHSNAVEQFVSKRKEMSAAVAQVVSPGDSPEVKLQKIYARCQQIHNLSFDPDKSDQQQKRAKLKEINDVADIWKLGYSGGSGINWLFLSLVRAAGLDAYPVLISTRNEHFFDDRLMNSDDLVTNVVLVKVNGQDQYFDPGTLFTPYGFLPWHETASKGLRLDKDGGDWVTSPVPASSASKVERSARLSLTTTGDLEGKLVVTYSGLEALWRRLDSRDDDEVERRKFLEDEINDAIAGNGKAELINKPEWNSSSPTLTAEFDLKVEGWAASAGRRQLLSLGLFSKADKHAFEPTNRVHPVYFHFPFQVVDDVTVELPAGVHVDSVPPPSSSGGQVITFSLKAEHSGSSLHWQRHFVVDTLMLQTKYYPALHQFYQLMRSSDDQQIVLSRQ